MARKRGLPPGKGKGKALVPPMKGGAPPAGPPPRPVRGRVAIAVPVVGIAKGRGMGPPPPGRGAPPRMMPPGAARGQMAPETPRAERLEAPPLPPSSRAPIMQRRGAPAAMSRLRRGQVSF